jgi:hypothetical protein
MFRGKIQGEPGLRGAPACIKCWNKLLDKQVLRSAQDFGSRIIRLLYASSLSRSDRKKEGLPKQAFASW